jgi:UDP-galactopyranose mutase
MWVGLPLMALDYVVVGAGMFGSVFARCLAEQGRRLLVIDQRAHIGGNCYSESVAGIQVHRYGPHIFHTNSRRVWAFVNRFAEFNHYRHRTVVNFRGRLLSFPINLLTLSQLWGVTTPDEAWRKLAEVREPIADPQNLEEWILGQVGRELYETFVRGYTTKQWEREPRELPASIIRRIPIRTTYNDRYFDDRYEGIPIGGYTRMFENMLDHENIRVETDVNFFANRHELEQQAGRLVYTGPVDEFFDYRFGRLEYRSLRFETQIRGGDFQGNAIVNYTAAEVPYTRITEHKHFEMLESDRTVITYEFPDRYTEGKTPYYPIRDQRNTAVYERYRQLAEAQGTLFGGRLATYQYLDMHQVVGQALAAAEKETAARRGRAA